MVDLGLEALGKGRPLALDLLVEHVAAEELDLWIYVGPLNEMSTGGPSLHRLGGRLQVHVGLLLVVGAGLRVEQRGDGVEERGLHCAVAWSWFLFGGGAGGGGDYYREPGGGRS